MFHKHLQQQNINTLNNKTICICAAIIVSTSSFIFAKEKKTICKWIRNRKLATAWDFAEKRTFYRFNRINYSDKSKKNMLDFGSLESVKRFNNSHIFRSVPLQLIPSWHHGPQTRYLSPNTVSICSRHIIPIGV